MNRAEHNAIARAGYTRIREARIEDYLELRSWGITRREAAQRLGVTLRTLDRYDAAIKQRKATAAAQLDVCEAADPYESYGDRREAILEGGAA